MKQAIDVSISFWIGDQFNRLLVFQLLKPTAPHRTNNTKGPAVAASMTAGHIQSGTGMIRCENGGCHNVKSPPVVNVLETWANTNRNAARPQVAIIATRVSFFISHR